MSITISSCNPSKYLAEDEKFIKNKKIEFKSDISQQQKNHLEYRLRRFTPPSNGRFLYLFDRAGIYYANKNKDTWYNNYFRETVGEKPRLFTVKKAEKAVRDMQNYLRNKKGYYEAEVSYEVEDNTRIAKDIIFLVDTKKRYLVNDFTFESKDTALVKKIKSLYVDKDIRRGTPIDESHFNSYKTEVADYLQNDGYAEFSVKNLRVFGDSSRVKKTVDVYMEILPPEGDSIHHQYHISNVNIHTAINHKDPDNIYKNDTVNDKNYIYTTRDHLVKPSTVERFIYVDKGDLFSKDARNQTLRRLSGLGPYRFVSVNITKDTSEHNGLNYDIFLNPFPNKWDFDMGLDAYYAQLNQRENDDIRLVGLNLGTEFRNKNLFGGAEKYSISTESGVEFQFVKPYLRTIILGLENSIEFPRLLNSFGFKTLLNTTNILNKEKYQHLEDNTVTRIGLGGNYVAINNFYHISTIKADYSYLYQYNDLSKFAFRQVGLDLNLYDIKEGFRPQVDRNQLLARSFVDNLLTGYFFRDLSYFYNDSSLDRKFSNSLYVNFEMSGVETYLVNKLYNSVSGRDNEWRINDNLLFAKYFRLQANYRHYRNLAKGLDLATRIYAGSAIPFGDNRFIPYGKQFYVGGPNSMRGWNQRELGPGSYDPRNEELTQVFYQQGDLKFEANAELRFDIVSFFEGAIFVDTGNVWTLFKDEQREGAQLTPDFYKEMAVSSGIGLRLDFDFFNIRFDFGYKLRYPYAYDLERPNRRWTSWNNLKSQGIGNLQVAVNYPF